MLCMGSWAWCAGGWCECQTGCCGFNPASCDGVEEADCATAGERTRAALFAAAAFFRLFVAVREIRRFEVVLVCGGLVSRQRYTAISPCSRALMQWPSIKYATVTLPLAPTGVVISSAKIDAITSRRRSRRISLSDQPLSPSSPNPGTSCQRASFWCLAPSKASRIVFKVMGLPPRLALETL